MSLDRNERNYSPNLEEGGITLEQLRNRDSKKLSELLTEIVNHIHESTDAHLEVVPGNLSAYPHLPEYFHIEVIDDEYVRNLVIHCLEMCTKFLEWPIINDSFGTDHATRRVVEDKAIKELVEASGGKRNDVDYSLALKNKNKRNNLSDFIMVVHTMWSAIRDYISERSLTDFRAIALLEKIEAVANSMPKVSEYGIDKDEERDQGIVSKVTSDAAEMLRSLHSLLEVFAELQSANHGKSNSFS